MIRRLLYSDNFNRTDAALDNETWQPNSAHPPMEILGEEAVGVSGQTASTGTVAPGMMAEGWVSAVIVTMPTGSDTMEIDMATNASGAGITLRVSPTVVDVIIRLTVAGDPTLVSSTNRTLQAGDIIRLEHEEPSTSSHVVRAYVNEVEEPALAATVTYTDTLYTRVGMRIQHSSGDMPAFDDFACGDWTDGASVTDINGDNTAKSNGNFVINGAGMDQVTEVNATDGTTSYPLTISDQSGVSITIAPWSVHDTVYDYGQLSVILTTVDGTLEHTYTQQVEGGWQAVVLSSVDDTLMAKDIPGIVDGDTLEIPAQVGASSVTLLENSDVLYDPAVPDGTTHTRWWYDASANAWDSGTATINRDAQSTNPPSFRATPAPPNALVGIPYSYSIGAIIDGARPLTLTDSGNALPPGLAYNSAEPETIVGTPIGGVGSTVHAGIVTRAVNTDGTTESAPFTIVVEGYPVLSEPNAGSITASGADLRVTTNQVIGRVYWIADILSSQPTPAQIMAGQASTGSSATASGNAIVSQTGQQGPFRSEPFPAGLRVSYWFVQTSADGINTSNVVGSSFLTTTDSTAPSPGDTPDTLVSFYNRGATPTTEPD